MKHNSWWNLYYNADCLNKDLLKDMANKKMGKSLHDHGISAQMD